MTRTKYKIGEFSRLGRVTVRTLRHYEKIGLLKPGNSGTAIAKVQHCDTPDGEFSDTELTYEGSATEDTEKRWRIPLDMKRYIRLHVEGTSDAAVRLTVRV